MSQFLEADYWANLALRFYPADDPKIGNVRRLLVLIEGALSEMEKTGRAKGSGVSTKTSSRAISFAGTAYEFCSGN